MSILAGAPEDRDGCSLRRGFSRGWRISQAPQRVTPSVKTSNCVLEITSCHQRKSLGIFLCQHVHLWIKTKQNRKRLLVWYCQEQILRRFYVIVIVCPLQLISNQHVSLTSFLKNGTFPYMYDLSPSIFSPFISLFSPFLPFIMFSYSSHGTTLINKILWNNCVFQIQVGVVGEVTGLPRLVPIVQVHVLSHTQSLWQHCKNTQEGSIYCESGKTVTFELGPER